MHLLVDGDSCPADRRTIIATAAHRLRHSTNRRAVLFFVHHSVTLSITGVRIIHSDDADQEILRRCAADDLVITRDLLLSEQLLRARHGVTIIDYCGRALTAESIRPRLAYRSALLSDMVTHSRGEVGDLKKCRQQFADTVDRIITQNELHAKEGT